MNTKHTEETMKWSSYLALDNENIHEQWWNEIRTPVLSASITFGSLVKSPNLDPQTCLLGLLWGFSTAIQVAYLAHYFVQTNKQQQQKMLAMITFIAMKFACPKIKSKDESRKWCMKVAIQRSW